MTTTDTAPSPSRVIMVGVGGLGRQMLDILRDALDSGMDKRLSIAGVVDDGPSQIDLERLNRCFPGTPYLGTVTEWLESASEPHHYIIGIGSGEARRKIDASLAAAGHEAMTLVHPTASVSRDAQLGPGTMVGHMSVIDTNVVTGRCVHVGANVMVGHDVVAEDYANINSSTQVSGNVRVGESAWVGAGSSIRQGLRIGAYSTVGLGAAVVKDVPEGITVTGVPAVPMEKRTLTIGLLCGIGRTLDRFFEEIVQHWRDQGAQVATAAGTPSERFPDQTVIDGLTRNPHPSNRRAMKGLRDWVREAGVDIVVTNTATASMLVRAAGVGVPVVYFCHGLHWNGNSPKDAPFRLIEKTLLSRTDGVVCINAADQSWFEANSPTTPLLRLTNGVGLDTERFYREPENRWDGKGLLRIAWCGEFSERKNPMAALEVARVLERRGIDFRLEMLGVGPLADAPAMQDSVGGRVVRVGWTDPQPHFREAHVLMQTARWEGLPRVALEAVAMGRPTAGFDVKGVQDIPGAFVVPEDDYEALADAVLEAADRGAQDLPPVEDLSYRHAADLLLGFARQIAGVRR